MNESLGLLAEVAIALAGFAAIVVLLRRDDTGVWSSDDADQFHGMILHSISAVSFAFLPTLLNVVVQDTVTSIHIACAVLGAQIIVHCIAVLGFSTSGRSAKIALSFGFLIGLLQFGAFTDWGVHREMHIYLVGVIWHILQAGMLFVMLVWIPKGNIRD